MTSAVAPRQALADAKPVFDWFFGVGVSCVVAIYVRAIYFTPPDALLGLAQKIYYLHVPAFLAAYISVSLTALLSLVYLWLHDERADRLAEASGEVGLVFLCVGLSMGSLWARSSWGTYWVWWDMRLTLTLFLAFIVAAYLVLRSAIEESGMRARYSAVLGVLAALLIPFIHLSVYLFQAHLHPMPIVLKPDKPSLSGEMLTTFLLSFCAFAVFCVALIRARYRVGELRALAAALEEETV
ncbi:MAG TPA: cytochrome c biogenesis protein CcsA [Gemmatimonadaceae bacterium]|jgi:heme exporter protein C|nr:cytochrome c biogenesis protein CcsA [Gemmatimonadaceae bacterium]